MFFFKKKVTYFLFLTIILNINFSQDKIFFIYNSKDDFYTIVSDTFHKTLKPNTYPCQLCKLTYNTFSKKKKWKEYLENLNYEYDFFYKEDSFVIDNKISEFPIILIGANKNYKILLSKNDININNSLDQLISMINTRIEKHENVKSK